MIKIGKIIRRRDNETENKKIFVSNIINSSAPSIDFYLMVSLSAIITALGLITDNIALVIAGMIVAPLLSPILAMALGYVIVSFKMFWRSFKILVLSTILATIFSILIGLVFRINSGEISLIEKMEISWLTFTIALVAGIIASYGWTRPNSKDYLSGIAIAVTIIPPLASLGLILSDLNMGLFIYILNFFLMNVVGIFFGSLIVFSLMNFYKIKKRINREIKKEENGVNKAIKIVS